MLKERYQCSSYTENLLRRNIHIVDFFRRLGNIFAGADGPDTIFRELITHIKRRIGLGDTFTAFPVRSEILDFTGDQGTIRTLISTGRRSS